MLLVLWNLSYIQTGVRTLRKDSPVVHMADQAELGNGHWYTDGCHSHSSARFPELEFRRSP